MFHRMTSETAFDRFGLYTSIVRRPVERNEYVEELLQQQELFKEELVSMMYSKKMLEETVKIHENDLM